MKRFLFIAILFPVFQTVLSQTPTTRQVIEVLKQGEMAFAARNDTIEQVFIIRKQLKRTLKFYYSVTNTRTNERVIFEGTARRRTYFGEIVLEDVTDVCAGTKVSGNGFTVREFDYKNKSIELWISVGLYDDRMRVFSDNKLSLPLTSVGVLRRTPLPLLQ